MNRRRHILVIAALLLLCAVVQVVLIRRATVPGLDAVRFVRIARLIETRGLLESLRHQREPPLFPVWVWLVHKGIASAVGELRSSWAISAQLAAAIPLVLAVVPVYFLSVRLVGPRAALAGALVFCVLPEVSRLGADGITDGMHLLLFCLALWAVVTYFTAPPRTARGQGAWTWGLERGQRPSGQLAAAASRVLETPSSVTSPALPASAAAINGDPRWLLAAGVLAALAVLVRPEALMLPVALVATLAAFQAQPDRHPWSRWATAMVCLLLGCGLVLGPYLVVVGPTNPNAAVARILGRYEPPAGDEDPPPPEAGITPYQAGVWQLAGGEPMSFAPKEPTTNLRRRGCVAAAAQFADELAEAFGYLMGIFALIGLWRLRRVLVRPVDRFAQIYSLLFSLAIIHFTAREGYLSARHLVPLVVLGIGCAGYGMLEVGRWIAKGRPLPCSADLESDGREPADCRRRRWAWALVGLTAAVCVIELIEPLHSSRLGHRRAAEWLAQETDVPGAVLDTRGWTGLYSGRPTYRYENALEAFSDPKLAYVVLERRELEYASRRSRTLRHLLALGAERVATFPESEAEPSPRSVVVYRWRPKRFSRWVVGRATGTQRAKAHLRS